METKSIFLRGLTTKNHKTMDTSMKKNDLLRDEMAKIALRLRVIESRMDGESEEKLHAISKAIDVLEELACEAT